MRARLNAARVGLVFGVMTCGVSSAAADPLPTDQQLEDRAGAWDRSVEQERAGQVIESRQTLMRGWGLESSSYEVTVRLAWLSLQLEDAATAVYGYERARALAGAGPEATEGLADALTLRGWQAFEEGDRADAREDWRLALRYEPDQPDAQRGLELARELRIEPELWGAFVFTTGAGPDSMGGGGLLHVPIQVKDWLGFRLAYRHVETSEAVPAEPEPGRRPGSGSRVRFYQDDIHAGIGLGTSYLWFEGMGIVIIPSDEGVAAGEAARLRLGFKYGLQVEQAVLVRDDGAGGQLLPTAFVWPLGWLGFGAGARFTFDPAGQDVSAVVGASVVPEPVELHLQAHVGVERWPVTMAMPQVLTLADDVNVGGTLTAMFSVSEAWAVGLQGQVERIDSEGQGGVFGSVALGLRWSPKL